MSAKDNFVLHIGFPKTGTTTLQKCLFSKHPEIHYLGKNCENGNPKGCRSKNVYNLLSPMLWNFTKEVRHIPFKEDLEQQLLEDNSEAKVVVASWEGIVNFPEERFIELIKRMRSVVSPFRIMVTIRNPLDQLPSLYLQNLKGQFFHSNKIIMGNSFFLEIDEWLNKYFQMRTAANPRFFYCGNILSSVEMLGRENVGVFVFEELVTDPDSYYRRICNFIDIDFEQSMELLQNKHLHERITQDQISFLRQLNRSRWQKLFLKVKGRRYRRRLFPQKAGNNHPAKVILSPEWKAKLSDAAKPDNRWLVNTFQLPLEKYGYSL